MFRTLRRSGAPRLLLALVAIVVAGPRSSLVASAASTSLVHHAVSTRDAAAQRAFDDGLLLLYAFNPEEAVTRFQSAARSDPHLAMAYWGISVAAGPNVNTEYDLARARIGAEAAARAKQLEAYAGAEERAYIEAVTLRYRVRSKADVPVAEQAYARAMERLSRHFPGDPDAAALAAESYMDLTPLNMWQPDGRATQYTRRVIALLDGVLERNPNHVGANHFMIHAYDGSPAPQKALESARRLASQNFPPAAEHLAHMPEHVFLHTGDYDAANAAGQRAVALFRAYLPIRSTGVHDPYFRHDLQMLEYGEMMAGNWRHARAAAQAVAAQIDDTAAEVECYLRFHRDRELLDLPAPREPDVRWHFARALAFARLGMLTESRTERSALDANREPQGRIARDLVDAELDERSGHEDESLAQLRDAIRVQDTLSTREPPRWFYPVRETLGGRLLHVGRTSAAAAVFEEDLRRNHGNGRSLFGLSIALRTSKPSESRRAASDFARAWEKSDTRLEVENL